LKSGVSFLFGQKTGRKRDIPSPLMRQTLTGTNDQTGTNKKFSASSPAHSIRKNFKPLLAHFLPIVRRTRALRLEKKQMLGFLKNVFSKPVGKTNGHAHPTLSAPPKPVAGKTPASIKPLTAPKSVNPVLPTTAPLTSNGGGQTLQLPFHTILNNLPLELKGRIRQAGVGDRLISLPAGQLLAQLAHGSVKISFGELRAALPGIFAPESDLDDTQVVLPLHEVLARLNPALLMRRQNQKQMEVPEEISSPFDDRGQQLAFSSTKPPTPAVGRGVEPVSNPASVPIPPAPMEPVQPIVFRKAATFAPTPPPSAVPPRGTPPTIPAPVAFRGVGVSPVLPTPEPFPRQSANERMLSVPLGSVSEAWPESLRLEIAQLNLSDARLGLPGNLIIPALQQGKVIFTWQVLRSWLQPAARATMSAHDDVSVELPLKIIAPLFMASQKESGKVVRKVAIDETIPNLFFGFPQPAAPVTPVTPAMPAEVISQPTRAVNKPVDTNFYVWNDTSESANVDETEYKRKPASGTDFISRCATPNEVVSRAAALEGVAGALIALPDGLMVASKVAPDLNGDTLAAFLPHIFGKVSQCTKELRMGDLNNLNFTVGNVPWKIFRVNAIFFAAFGRAGQALPGVDLAALAAELDRKKQ
jgi:predicted regulator of Ras-like GTPase activity (Roadblock/LC7/MglB family)